MNWLIVGTALVLLLTTALAVDLRDRKRGGRPVAPFGGARLDAVLREADLGERLLDAHRGG
ncbi:hypothetical protein ED92_08375 [Amycolatopsis sp. MJM2582]|uniref:Putative membrane protein n=1 Tax=Amycolatopsis japonica TaxID=208439 RepID=A0A075V332_9PSEU|nr:MULTISPECIES: hypothetical protein [Amycolatopsis]AIG80827.1 Putative membrane protein [Amycolatopsis japonica]KFZ83907.1 hypothetical protein ED92_08375 [Amycolatopsis sp. MJM2582]OKJ98126.1 hypothetical protein AMK34_14530 [Amycolatopsis sp. CB00013]RSN21576.1 hypothetical protein DMC61_34750 [Amycolatopsis sp. WAC 04169]RSN47292.1 hypothetical protein DMC64_08370 [Amycolatopsis sp. WAC 04197]